MFPAASMDYTLSTILFYLVCFLILVYYIYHHILLAFLHYD